MRIRFLGHAGLLVETAVGNVLVDPWFNPAFFGSWFPYPRNDGIALPEVLEPDYLYVSHVHEDHFDTRFLRERVGKSTRVILPPSEVPILRERLESLGFFEFIQISNGVPFDVDGLEIAVLVEEGLGEGAGGDSALLLSDGEHRLFDQNDCRLVDPSLVNSWGPIDVHLLQFSGASWFPHVYDLPTDEKAQLVEARVRNGFERALKSLQSIGAGVVVPFAGPACFLDEELRHLNNTGTNDKSIFASQLDFSAWAHERGVDNLCAVYPDTTMDLERGICRVVHNLSQGVIDQLERDPEEYLAAYASDWSVWLSNERARWPAPKASLAERLADWWEPLIARAPVLASSIHGATLITSGDDAVVVDFARCSIRDWVGEEVDYQFLFPRPLFEACIEQRVPDLSVLLLSSRWSARRSHGYDPFLYQFFASLRENLIRQTERLLTAAPVDEADDEDLAFGQWIVQRRCPHRGADLSVFGLLDGCVLTCTLHGHAFNLETGECMNADGVIRTRRA